MTTKGHVWQWSGLRMMRRSGLAAPFSSAVQDRMQERISGGSASAALRLRPSASSSVSLLHCVSVPHCPASRVQCAGAVAATRTQQVDEQKCLPSPRLLPTFAQGWNGHSLMARNGTWPRVALAIFVGLSLQGQARSVGAACSLASEAHGWRSWPSVRSSSAMLLCHAPLPCWPGHATAPAADKPA